MNRIFRTTRHSSRSARLAGPVAVFTAFALLAVACTPAPVPVSQSSHDPSSPTAAEGAAPVILASTGPGAPAASAPAHAGHAGHGDHAGHAPPAGPASASTSTNGEAYVCPMHPEVTAATPGLCPKCNMKLVPKK